MSCALGAASALDAELNAGEQRLQLILDQSHAVVRREHLAHGRTPRLPGLLMGVRMEASRRC